MNFIQNVSRKKKTISLVPSKILIYIVWKANKDRLLSLFTYKSTKTQIKGHKAINRPSRYPNLHNIMQIIN